MAYSWNQKFEDGETRAACSKCGVPYRWPSELTKLDDGFFYCKRRCLEQTVKARDKIIAQSRKRREMPPPKFVQAPRYAEDYLDSEAAAFRSITATAPTLTSAVDLGWAVNYLADIVLQGKRSTLWDARAKSVMATCCNTLLTLQYGAPSGPAPTLTVEKLRYGGFGDGTSLFTAATSIGTVALAKAYQVLGTVSYLDAASRGAHFLRHMQCQNLDNNSQYTTWNGGLYHVGGFAAGVTAAATITWTSRYGLFDCGLATWALQVMANLQGAGTSYGGVAGTDFTAATAATLAVMIAEATAFMMVGAYDIAGGVLTTGLSTTYPRAFYEPQVTGSPSIGTWGLQLASAGTPSFVLYGKDFTAPLFALNFAGASGSFINPIHDWLRSFTANPANASPSEDDQLLIGTTTGTYNPKVAIADQLDVLSDTGAALTTEHVGAIYDWAATALLAPLSSARYPVEFLAAKTAFVIPQPSQRGPTPAYRYICQTGKSGLSYQYHA